MKKKEKLKDLVLKLHRDYDVEEVKREFKEEFGTLPSSEIAKLESELIAEGMEVSEIQNLCNIHADVFTGNISDLHSLDEVDREEGHPLHIFRKENVGLSKFLDEKFLPLFEKYKETTDEILKVDMLAAVHELSKIEKHYTRKELLLFPFLEKAGVNGPGQVMWGKDDEIRALFREIDASLDAKELIAKIESLLEEIQSMIVKENEILSPLLLQHIKPFEWITVAEASADIGYAFTGGIEGASPSDAINWLDKSRKDEGINTTAENLEQSDKMTGDTVYFPSGAIDYDDLIVMLNHYPQDITFIDRDDRVVFFSEGKNPVFPRTRTIIGRDVRNCHPPKSVPVVEKLLKDFKEGVKDEDVRFLKKGNRVLSIRYFAVRDPEGNYRGTLEATEDISNLLKALDESAQ